MRTKKAKRSASSSPSSAVSGFSGGHVEVAKTSTARLVLRLPSSIGDSLEQGPWPYAPSKRSQRDWSPLREVLDRWARKAEPLKAEADPPQQVCFHVSAGTADALRAEAARLTEVTGQTWTVSMVVGRLWADATS